MVLDRLSVLVIRIARTAEMARSDSPRAAEYGARLPSLQGQLDALSVANSKRSCRTCATAPANFCPMSN